MATLNCFENYTIEQTLFLVILVRGNSIKGMPCFEKTGSETCLYVCLTLLKNEQHLLEKVYDCG